MVRRRRRGESDGMVLAGAIELEPEVVTMILLLLAAVALALCAVGGVIGCLLARRPLGFLAGVAAFAPVAAITASHTSGARAVALGWLASAAAGLALPAKPRNP